MDFDTILNWLITLLTITGLIVLRKAKNKNRDKKKLAVLQTFAKENNCTISSYDAWNKTFIGIDNKETNKLFFIRTIPNSKIRQVIDISEVADCRMSKIERKVRYDKKTVNVIDEIEIIFSFYNYKPDISLEFYNSDYDQLTLTGELQLAQKWTGMIKNIVSTNREGRANEKEKVQVSPVINQLKVSEQENSFHSRKNTKNPLKETHVV